MSAKWKWTGLAGCVVLAGAFLASAQADHCHSWGGWRSAYQGGEVVYSEPAVVAIESDQPRFGTSYEPGGYTVRDEPAAGRQESRGYRLRPLQSTTVRLASGGDIGRIEELVISDSGCVDYMIVSFTNLPGSGGRLAAIPWGAARLDLRGRVAILDMQRDELYDAPIFFSRGLFPDLYEGEWATRVHTHFGLDSTRIERAYRSPDGDAGRDGQGDGRDREQDRDGARDGAGRRESKPAPAARESKPTPVPQRDDAPAPGGRDARPEPAGRDAKPAPAPDRDPKPADADKAQKESGQNKGKENQGESKDDSPTDNEKDKDNAQKEQNLPK